MHRFWYAYSDLDGADHYLPNIPQGREGGLCYLAPDLLQRDRIFVLPIMVFQLLEVSSACFFTADNLAWVKLLAVLGAWAITFLISASCHRNLQEGKVTLVIERLVRTNWWRTVLWTIAFVVSVVIYYS